MDEADDDADPDGPVHPAAAFYGLWPRFAAAEETDAAVVAESEAALTE